MSKKNEYVCFEMMLMLEFILHPIARF